MVAMIVTLGYRRNTLRAMIGASIAASFCLGSPGAWAVVVTVDVPSTCNTIVLEDCNTPGPDRATLSADNTNPTSVPTSLGNSGGVATYTVPAKSSDPRWEFFDTPTYNVSRYGYLRTRLASGNTTTIEAWPRVPVGATTTRLGTGSGSTFLEYSKAWVNPTDANIVTATKGGFRIDMVVSNGLDSDITSALDYFMVDTSQTVGFEFDREGDRQGCGLSNVATDSPSVANSLLSATLNASGSTDANVNVPVSLNTDVFDYVEIRMRQSVGTFSEIFFGTSTQGGLAEARKVTFGIADGQFHTYLFDFSSDSRWDGTLNAFRLDPANGRYNATFDIDYIRFRDFAYVPEPATLGLLLLGLVGVAYARLRRA